MTPNNTTVKDLPSERIYTLATELAHDGAPRGLHPEDEADWVSSHYEKYLAQAIVEYLDEKVYAQNNDWEDRFDGTFVREVETGYHTSQKQIVGDVNYVKQFIETLLTQTKQDTVKEVIEKITDVVAYKKKGPVYAEAAIEIINQLRSEYGIKDEISKKA